MPKLYLPENDVFDYDDVSLVPQEGIVKSRSMVDVSAVLGGRRFALPVIPANMSTIVDESTCVWLAERNYFYVMHRFNVNPVEFTQRMQNAGLIASVSLGVKEADYGFVERFKETGVTPEYVTVDVAHGDTREVFRMVKHLKTMLPSAFVIAGNVATTEAAHRLVEAGADSVKIGVGPGKVCITAPNTGFGTKSWQLSAVSHIAESLKGTGVAVIADGGIRHYGDFAKSVAFGADMVMVGGLFASHNESPGELIDVNGEKFKEFFGSASEFQKGESKHVEGKRELVPYKGSLADTLRIMREHLQSSVSYAGGDSLEALHDVPYVLLRK